MGQVPLGYGMAVWVSDGLLAWPPWAAPQGVPAGDVHWQLRWAPGGGIDPDAPAPVDAAADLAVDPAGLPSEVTAAHPQLLGFLALRLGEPGVGRVGQLLRGQVAVTATGPDGRSLAASHVQLAAVLDARYAASAAAGGYGATAAGGLVTFRLWAPTATTVALLLWPPGTADLPADRAVRVPMNRAEDGSWSVTTDAAASGARYLYEVQVYAPTTGQVETNLVTDPFSVALTRDSTRSVVLDLADPAYRPALWLDAPSPPLPRGVDSTIYELHVRDFSISDDTVPEAHRGRYLAFADDTAGTRHLRALAEAGLTTVHLLPTFDITTIPEDPAQRLDPGADLATYPRDSAEQQRIVDGVRRQDGFNWGYDPWHWSAPEGSYAVDADGGARVAEFRTMVGALHGLGLRVVLDQVFNHTTASGQDPRSVLDRVVPGYYHRLDPTGAVYTTTCCQNVATEHAMAGLVMVASVVSWARNYRVDGFRFDIMAHHSRANLLAVRAALDELTLERDGVDGRSIYLYGEGWSFGEVAGNARFVQAAQGQLCGTGIGSFSDRLRDAVRGGGPFDADPRRQGFGSGLAGDPNGAPVNGSPTDQAAALAWATDLVQVGLAGNLRGFVLRSQATGALVRGDAVDYYGSPAAYADEPDEVVTYVDAHDGETLFDALTAKLPVGTSMADRVRMNTLALAVVTLAQTPVFWHAGAELLRSKSFDRNSYDSGDWFNRLDWTGADNGFGHGLPLAKDNAGRWDVLSPLLADPRLKPSAADVHTAAAAARDLLRLRFSTPLFRLGSAHLVGSKVSFPMSGTELAHPGVVVMVIDDTAGPDVDPELDTLLVVVNATPSVVSQRVPGLVGADLRLSPVQAGGSDEVVRSVSWRRADGLLDVPARTVAVLVQPSTPPAHA